LIGFFKIKPRHPDVLKNRSGWKKTAVGLPLGALSTTLWREQCCRTADSLLLQTSVAILFK